MPLGKNKKMPHNVEVMTCDYCAQTKVCRLGRHSNQVM